MKLLKNCARKMLTQKGITWIDWYFIALCMYTVDSTFLEVLFEANVALEKGSLVMILEFVSWLISGQCFLFQWLQNGNISLELSLLADIVLEHINESLLTAKFCNILIKNNWVSFAYLGYYDSSQIKLTSLIVCDGLSKGSVRK